MYKNKQQWIQTLKIHDAEITFVVNSIRHDIKYGMTFEESLATFERFGRDEYYNQAFIEIVTLRLKKLNLIK